jgi:hypothetical protein
MPWPTSSDYLTSLTDPTNAFIDADLRRGEVERGPDGRPLARSGAFADVFRVRTPAGDWAVKCYTCERKRLADRYREVEKHLAASKPPFAVTVVYQSEGVFARCSSYPLVKMSWAEGERLDRFVTANLHRPDRLGQLFDAWVALAGQMRRHRVAHGDLSHTNVVVDQDGPGGLRLRLLDYDGLTVPALVGQRNEEAGHAAYQHPQRTLMGYHRLDTDHFAHLVVAATLRALAVAGPELWERHHRDTNLLCSEPDLTAPGRSALMQELWRLPDPLARSLAGQLILATQRPIDQVPPLEEVLAGAASGPTPEEDGRVTAVLHGEVYGTRGSRLAMTPARLSGPDLRAAVANAPLFVPPASAPPPPARRRRWPAVAAGSAAVAGLAALLWLALSQS